MDDEARARDAETKRLVFRNLINGVPPEVVGPAFHLSLDDVRREFVDVLYKIRCYMRRRDIVGFERLETLAQARAQRDVMLLCLSRLGPKYLTGAAEYKRMETHPLDEAFIRDHQVALMTGAFQ